MIYTALKHVLILSFNNFKKFSLLFEELLHQKVNLSIKCHKNLVPVEVYVGKQITKNCNHFTELSKNSEIQSRLKILLVPRIKISESIQDRCNGTTKV